MSRRVHTVSVKCAEPTCREHAHYETDTRRDADRIWREHNGTYKCLRHAAPSEWMSTSNPERSVTWIVHAETYGKFWKEGEGGRVGSGFTHGPGFKADASGFPVGTRLTVTARIELPRSDSSPIPPAAPAKATP